MITLVQLTPEYLVQKTVSNNSFSGMGWVVIQKPMYKVVPLAIKTNLQIGKINFHYK